MCPPISGDGANHDDGFPAGSPEAALAADLRDGLAACWERVGAILASPRSADGGLSALLEDIGNRFIDLSEHVNASSRPTRNRPALRLVSGGRACDRTDDRRHGEPAAHQRLNSRR